MEELKKATLENCKLFCLSGTYTYGKVLDIYDGDTLDLAVIVNNKLYHFKARMYGYDSPEMKPPKDDKNRNEIKKKAILSRNRLWDLLVDEKVPFGEYHQYYFPVVCHEFDKYGRLLITAFKKDKKLEELKTKEICFEESINYQMIKEGYGYSYYGGNKQKLN